MSCLRPSEPRESANSLKHTFANPAFANQKEFQQKLYTAPKSLPSPVPTPDESSL
jgi:hypothetical protein